VQRAKALCHADGNVWKVCERPGHGAANRIVDDASRAEYLARARDQLMREQAGAASPQRS
jgi:hypothetical protein